MDPQGRHERESLAVTPADAKRKILDRTDFEQKEAKGTEGTDYRTTDHRTTDCGTTDQGRFQVIIGLNKLE